MILVGNQRGGSKNLALHLLKDENERVQVHQIRGFASDNLESALQESYAMSRATKCKQHMFSLSLNPPHNANISAEEFENTVDRAEESLGLQGQPRAIVFHTKNGRSHAHAVWCRIDTENMKAVQLSFTRRKMQDLSRDLYREHGWKMPRGFVRHEERDPRNFTLAEWQQCKRAARDPTKTKEVFQDAWAISDGKTAFANALEAHGLILAKGDRRGHVAVDHNGEVFAVSKYVGIRAKQVKDKLGSADNLISKDKAHLLAVQRVNQRLSELSSEEKSKAQSRVAAIDRAHNNVSVQLSDAEATQREKSKEDRRRLEEEQSARFRKGLMGLLDRVTGRRKRVEMQNRAETFEAERKAKSELEQLRRGYIEKQQSLGTQRREEMLRAAYVRRELANDRKRLAGHFMDASGETSSRPSNKKRGVRKRRPCSRNSAGPVPER